MPEKTADRARIVSADWNPYCRLLRRKRKAVVRYASLAMVKEAMGQGPGWRRHIPPALFLASLAAMLLAAARPVVRWVAGVGCGAAEAGAIAVVYAVIIGVMAYRELQWKHIPGILMDGLGDTVAINDVLVEIAGLAAQGVKEVTLLGQNVNAYRSTISGEAADFALLLEYVADVPGIAQVGVQSTTHSGVDLDGTANTITFDVTAALHRKGENTLKVRVWDPTERGEQPRGLRAEGLVPRL